MLKKNPLYIISDAELPLDLWYVSASVLGLIIIILLASILLFRQNRFTEEQRQQRIIQQWRPILQQSLTGLPEPLPSLPPRDHLLFLQLWNKSYEFLPETITAPLIRLAQTVGSPILAAQLLQSRLLSQRILGVLTLGRLQEPSAWAPISALLTHHNSFLAFHAAQALLKIDTRAALPLLIPILGERTDWSPLKVVSMLKTVGRDVASEALVNAAIHGDQQLGPRLIRYLPATQSPQGLTILRDFIRKGSLTPNMLAACLFVFGEFRDPADLPIVRHHLANEAWYVRVQAATALGKLGTVDDEGRLILLFNDEQWWVRYRAGEALVSLESMTEEKLLMLQESLTTPEAHEILAPILAKFRARRSPIAVRP